jgi:osmotically-inducible protein OsmY
VEARGPQRQRLRMTAMPTIENSLDSLISSAIGRSPHLKSRKVRFEAHEGRVVLRGTVSSYYQKQMAQEVVRRLQGVERIENELEVDWTSAAVGSRVDS